MPDKLNCILPVCLAYNLKYKVLAKSSAKYNLYVFTKMSSQPVH